MASTRAWPVPPAAQTLHLVGDMHHLNQQVYIDRLAKAMTDIRSGSQMITPKLHLCVGDLVSDGLSAQDTRAKTWLAQLPAPYTVTLGNHDIWQAVRTGAAWEAVWGPKNYTYDLGFAQIVTVGPDAWSVDDNTITLSAATLSWLDTTLATATKDCIVCCHAPLNNTVIGPTSGTYADPGWPVYSSVEPGFYAEPNASIRTILGNRSRAKVYISGHTHSPIDAPGFSKLETVGSRQIISINASALYYVGRVAEPAADPLISVYLTWVYSTNSIELRFRDHGAGIWSAPRGSDRITTIGIPA